MRRLLTPLCVLALAAVTLAGELPGGLTRVPDAKVALAYVVPGTNWSKYHSVQLRPLIIPPIARNTAPNGARPAFGESYMLRDKDVADIQAAYDQTMREVFTKAGLAVVDTPRPDTLIVAAQVQNITLAAPIESTRHDYMNRGRTFSKGGSSMAIAAVLADGATGRVVAEAEDRKYQTDIWGQNTRVRNLADARRAFGEWGRALRDRLIAKGE